MLFLINILIALCTASTVSAGPILIKYTNTSSLANPTDISDAHFASPSNSPSSSPLLVDGITRLPTSLFAESPTRTFNTPSSGSGDTSSNVLSSPNVATSRLATKHQPSDIDGITSTASGSQPSSFQTLEQQHPATTKTVWSTTWTTVMGSSQVSSESTNTRASQPSSLVSQPDDAATTTEQTTDWTSAFSFDPLPTNPSQSNFSEPSPTVLLSMQSGHPDPSSHHQASDSATNTAKTSEFTTSSHPSNPTADPSELTTSTYPTKSDTTDLPRFSFDPSTGLPEVVTQSAPATQADDDAPTSNTSNIPGITIVPQNPSVIYITTTVTDADVTTTLGQ